MNKVKSAICLTLMTLLVAVLCFVCLVSFNYGADNIHRFDSIVSQTAKDPDLGASYTAGDRYYLGGGYSAVYYPEGVISAKAYADNLAVMPEETEKQRKDKQEYADKYVRYPDANGAIYLEKEVAYEDYDANPNELSEEFVESVNSAVELLRSRYERLYAETRVDLVDEFTVRVFIPRSLSEALTPFAATGAFTVWYGTSSSSSSAEQILPKRSSESINDYVKGSSVRTQGSTPYIVINLTSEGKKIVSEKTSGASDTTGYLFFKVGDYEALSLTVSSPIKGKTITLSSSSFTYDSANIRAILVDTALNGEQTSLSLTMGETTAYPALYGENALTLIYIALGVCFAAMMVFFFVRYRLLAFVNLYTYLLFLCATVLCVWAIPFLSISVETILAFLMTSVLLCASNAIVFESVRKEYALGKTMASCVKSGYKKNLWHLFDLHIALAGLGFIVFFIALAPVRAFAFTFALTAVFSGVFSLVINRFMWCIMMALCKNKGLFTGFKREEVADDE